MKVYVEIDWRMWLFGVMFDRNAAAILIGPLLIDFVRIRKEHN